MMKCQISKPFPVASIGRQYISIDGRFLQLGALIKEHGIIGARPGHLRPVEGIELHDKAVDEMNAVRVIQRRLVRLSPVEALRRFVADKIMMTTIEASPFQVIDDRGQRFGADMEISQPIEGNLSPGHCLEILDDLFGNDGCLAYSPATDKGFMRLRAEQDG